MRSRYPVLIFVAVIFSMVASYFGPARASAPTSPPDPPEKKVQDGTRPAPDLDPYRESFDRQLVQPLMMISNSDSFGYSLDDDVSVEWVGASSDGTTVSFDLADDDFSDPIPIGFDFKFYENSYSQVYISTNGFLSFGEGSSSFGNTTIPVDTPPNNFIAPMWDDLAVGGEHNNGSVYYKTVGDSPNREFVVEWYEVSRRGSGSELLTFGLILYEKLGNIRFHYDVLGGVLNEATVGIEGPDGSDGLRYLYNEPMPEPVKDVLFTRPPDTPRVKALPTYQSGFAYTGKIDFPVVLSNTGEPYSDIFNLVASGDPSWDISFFSEDGISPLTDHDSDSIPDTGLLAPGEAKTITVRCQAPSNAVAGDFNQLYITATSSLDDTKNKTVSMQAAIPTSFAKAFADSFIGLNLALISQADEKTMKVKNWFYGPTLALSEKAQGDYIYIWEKNDWEQFEIEPYVYRVISFSNIEYVVVDRFGTHLQESQELTNNKPITSDDLSVIDRLPVSATVSQGSTGVVWVRDIVDDSDIDITTNSNIYFALLDAEGNLQDPSGLINITKNTDPRGAGDLNIPLFASPRITAISDTRFLIVWTDQRLMSTGDTSSIWYAVYDTSINDLVKYPTPLTSNDLDVKRYFDSNVTGLQGDKALVTYTIFNHNDSSYTIAYQVLDSNGNLIKSETVIPAISGWGPDVTQLSTGKIMLVWTNPVDNTIVYCLINKADYEFIENSLFELSNPNPRLPDYVSVTYDQEGRGILTWMDAGWNQYLYYALIDSSGAEITPPMIFHKGHGSNPLILSSYSGYGNAPYKFSGQIFLPIIRR